MLDTVARTQLFAESARLAGASDFEGVCTLLADIPFDEVIGEPDLAMDYANALYRSDRLDDANDLLARLSDACLRRKNYRVYRRWINLRGVLRVEFGDLPAAEILFRETFSRASESRDLSMQAAATFNMGSLAWVRCDWLTALTFFQRARATYSLLGRTYSLAGCDLNIAMTYREMGFWDSADSHFELALEGYTSDTCTRNLEIAAVETERALLVNATDQSEAAEKLTLRAISRIRPTTHYRNLGEAYRVLGIVLADQSRRSEALEWHRRALELATHVGNPLLQAEVCEEIALLDRDAGSGLLKQAMDLYLRLGASFRAAKAKERWERQERDLS